MKKQNKIIFSFLVSIILFLGFSFSTADAANKYWYKTGADANWDTVTGNWWDTDTEGVYSGQSASVPTTGDFVYIRGPIAPDTAPSTPVALSGFDTAGFVYVGGDASILFEAITSPISIQENGVLNFISNVNGGYSYVYWGGTTAATGTFTFSGNDTDNNGTVGDYAIFSEGAGNFGMVGIFSPAIVVIIMVL
jgi:hypothetical protein